MQNTAFRVWKFHYKLGCVLEHDTQSLPGIEGLCPDMTAKWLTGIFNHKKKKKQNFNMLTIFKANRTAYLVSLISDCTGRPELFIEKLKITTVYFFSRTCVRVLCP